MSRFDRSFRRRAYRSRYKIKKSGKLRMSVFRSERHMYVQIIDDACGKTLCMASTLDKSFRGTEKASNCKAAEKIGATIAARAIEAGIKEVVFDRGGYQYHGRVKALADGARNGGLVF